MNILSWNVNSIRIRKEQALSLIKSHSPDIICLQETKVSNDNFPKNIFENLGYYVYSNGIPSYNGVAIISKFKAEETSIHKFCRMNDSRHIQIHLNKISVHSLYVPAGGDIPDELTNEKFKHKLEFLDEMNSFYKFKRNKLDIVCGDFNVSPYQDDVWSHNQLKNVVSHTDIERRKLMNVLKNGKFIDTTRKFISPPENVFTWWSYRSKDYRKNNRGRRLDHIWVTDNKKIKAINANIISETRSQFKPSDHVPVTFEFEMD